MARKILFALTLLLTFTMTMPAVADVKKPLRYVTADSVTVWAYNGRDFRSIALSVDTTVRAKRFGISRDMWKSRTQLLKQWNEERKELNVVGGMGDVFAEPQAMSAYKSINKAAPLFLMKPEASFHDYIERAVYNAVMHAATDSTQQQGTLNSTLAAQTLISVPGLIYATSANGEVYVNLYTNSLANIPLKNQTVCLDQVTDMPVSGTVKMRFNKIAKGTSLTLHLRIPDWCVGGRNTPYIYIGEKAKEPTIYVNGHELSPINVDENGYVVITREWRVFDEVYISFPLQAHYILPANTPQENLFAPIKKDVALQYGPLVYFPTTDTTPYYFTPSQPIQVVENENIVGTALLKGMMYKTATPQDAKAEAVPFEAVPYAQMF